MMSSGKRSDPMETLLGLSPHLPRFSSSSTLHYGLPAPSLCLANLKLGEHRNISFGIPSRNLESDSSSPPRNWTKGNGGHSHWATATPNPPQVSSMTINIKLKRSEHNTISFVSLAVCCMGAL